MEKTKQFLYLPVAYHAALLIAMTVMFFVHIPTDTGTFGTGALGVLVMLDLAGILISPMFMALMGIAHAILHQGRVYDYASLSVIYLCVIGVLRIIAYLIQYRESFIMTLLMCGASLLVYMLWASIFAFTDKLMRQNKKPWQKPRKR